MKLVVLALCAAITTTAASDCAVCIHNRCYSTAAFVPGTTKLYAGKMAIHHESNVMYLYDDGIKAYDLNTNTMSPIQTPPHGNSQICVDDTSGDVYFYKHDTDSFILYKYQPKTNETKETVVSMPGNTQSPLKLWAHNGTVYFVKIHDETTGLNYLKGSTIERLANFENMTVASLVFDKFGNMFIKAGSEIYKLKPNEQTPVLFASSKYILSEDKSGEVYFYDVAKRFFYQVDTDSDQLYPVGAYDLARDGKKRPNLKEYLFDKDNNVVFKDKWSTLYYKVSTAECSFTFEEQKTRTRIVKERND